MLANCLLTACYLLANCFLTACYLLANCLLSSCYLLANGLLTATFLLMLSVCVSMKIRSTRTRTGLKTNIVMGEIGPPLKKGLGSPMETDQISFMSKSHFDKIVQLQLRELFPCSLTWILLCCLWSVSAKCWESDGGLPWYHVAAGCMEHMAAPHWGIVLHCSSHEPVSISGYHNTNMTPLTKYELPRSYICILTQLLTALAR